jgi:hypothetical protein
MILPLIERLSTTRTMLHQYVTILTNTICSFLEALNGGLLVGTLSPIGRLIFCFNLMFFPRAVTEYNGVFGAIQSLEFINDGKQFVSSSDITKKNSTDKALIVWDFETVMKQLQFVLTSLKSCQVSNQVYLEAYTCPCIKVHPDNKHFIAQSNGDYIAIFSSSPPFKLDKGKVIVLCITI